MSLCIQPQVCAKYVPCIVLGELPNREYSSHTGAQQIFLNEQMIPNIQNNIRRWILLCIH